MGFPLEASISTWAAGVGTFQTMLGFVRASERRSGGRGRFLSWPFTISCKPLFKDEHLGYQTSSKLLERYVGGLCRPSNRGDFE